MSRTMWLAAALWPFFAGVVHAQSFAIRLHAELTVRSPEGRTGPLPLVEERLQTEIDAQHATTTLRQVFHNTSGAALEGRYVVQAPLDARATGFAYYVGEQRVVGEVLERRAANRVYDQVTTARRDPAILEQTADGEYTFRVFPIQPGENKRVEITFAEWLSRRGDGVTYRAPMGSPDAQAEILIRDPRVRDVRSPTHHLDVAALPGGGVRVRTLGAIQFRGELELRYRIEEPAWALSSYLHRDPGQPAYFLLSLAAPPGLSDAVSAKDVTLVLDRSGSMAGEPIANARRAAMDVIRRLGPSDRLNVVSFDDTVDPLWEAPRPADASARQQALAFVSSLHEGGGTDIAFALRRVLEAQHDDQSGERRPRVVVFLTDGQSAVEPALEAASQDRRDVRVFTVGLGEGVNRALLSRLAADKRGRFTFIPDASRIEAEVGHLYSQIAQPLLVDVSLQVHGAVDGRVYPRSIPDLFVDDELVVRGRLRGEGPVTFVLRGSVGGRPVELRSEAFVPPSVQRPWVARRWAMARVDDLLDKILLEGDEPGLRDEVISLALAYDFVTPYTAFLAVPENELTAQAAQTLAQARSQRVSAQAQAQVQIATSAGATSQPSVAGSTRPSGARIARRVRARADGRLRRDGRRGRAGRGRDSNACVGPTRRLRELLRRRRAPRLAPHRPRARPRARPRPPEAPPAMSSRSTRSPEARILAAVVRRVLLACSMLLALSLSASSVRAQEGEAPAETQDAETPDGTAEPAGTSETEQPATGTPPAEAQAAGGTTYEPDQRGNHEEHEPANSGAASAAQTGGDAEVESMQVQPTSGYGRSERAEPGSTGFDLSIWLGGGLTSIDVAGDGNLISSTQTAGGGGAFGLSAAMRFGALRIGPRVGLTVESALPADQPRARRGHLAHRRRAGALHPSLARREHPRHARQRRVRAVGVERPGLRRGDRRRRPLAPLRRLLPRRRAHRRLAPPVAAAADGLWRELHCAGPRSEPSR